MAYAAGALIWLWVFGAIGWALAREPGLITGVILAFAGVCGCFIGVLTAYR